MIHCHFVQSNHYRFRLSSDRIFFFFFLWNSAEFIDLQKTELFFNKDVGKYLGLVPQNRLLTIEHYNQQVQCLDSERKLNSSAWNTWYFIQHKRQLQLPCVQRAEKHQSGNSIHREGLLFPPRGRRVLFCLVFRCHWEVVSHISGLFSCNHHYIPTFKANIRISFSITKIKLL